MFAPVLEKTPKAQLLGEERESMNTTVCHAMLQVTRRYNLLLHVDACLGGFVLPFARKLGHPIPAFDFSVRGVTSMSVDTHKFGMAHKGTSVVLYNDRSLRQYQYTKITEWTGGLYISPGEHLPPHSCHC